MAQYKRVQPGAIGAHCQKRPDRDIFSVVPASAKGNPKPLVERTKSCLRVLAFQDEELLEKSEVPQHQILALMIKAKGRSKSDPEKGQSGGNFYGRPDSHPSFDIIDFTIRWNCSE